MEFPKVFLQWIRIPVKRYPWVTAGFFTAFTVIFFAQIIFPGKVIVSFDILFKLEPVLVAYPPARIIYILTITRPAIFQAQVGLPSEACNKASDGVTFP